MVGGEAIPKSCPEGAGFSAGALSDASVSADRPLLDGFGLDAAQSAQVSESAPDFFDFAPKQSIWDPSSNSRGGYHLFDSMRSEIVVESLNPSAVEPVSVENYVAERATILNGAERSTFEKLLRENLGGVDADKAPRLEIDAACESAIEQLSRLRAAAVANGLSIDNLPEIVDAGLAEGFSVERIPAEFEKALKPGLKMELAAELEKASLRGGTLDGAAEIDMSSKPSSARESVAARVGDAVAGTVKGGGVWAGSLLLADALGIENPSMHFAFVIYSIEGEMLVEETARGVHAAVKAGTSIGEAWKATPVVRAFAGETAMARLMNLSKRTLVNPQARLVNHLGPGLLASKLGYAATRAVGFMLDMDPESVGDAANIVSTGAFFAPDIIARVAGGSAEVGAGYAAVGMLAVAAMLVDTGVEGAYMGLDYNYDYNCSLEMRAAERYKEEVMERQFAAAAGMSPKKKAVYLAGSAIERTLEDFGEVFMPNVVRRARAIAYHKMMGRDLDETLGGEEFWTKDYENAVEVRDALPKTIGGILVDGFDAQNESVEFYRNVDLAWLGEELDSDDNLAATSFDAALREYKKSPNYKAMKGWSEDRRQEVVKNYLVGQLGSEAVYAEAVAFKVAQKIQGELKTLRMMDLIEGDPIRELVTEEGGIAEGREDDFLLEYVAPAYDDMHEASTADDLRERIIEERRIRLVARILTAEADGASDASGDLMEVAVELGLANESGGLANTDVYAKAVDALAHRALLTKDDTVKEIVSSHSRKLFEERMALAGKSNLTGDEAARLEELNAMDASLRASVFEASAHRSDLMRMAAARGCIAMYVGGTISAEEMRRELESLELTAEEAAQIDEFEREITLEKIHASMPKPQCAAFGCGD